MNGDHEKNYLGKSRSPWACQEGQDANRGGQGENDNSRELDESDCCGGIEAYSHWPKGEGGQKGPSHESPAKALRDCIGAWDSH